MNNYFSDLNEVYRMFLLITNTIHVLAFGKKPSATGIEIELSKGILDSCNVDSSNVHQ